MGLRLPGFFNRHAYIYILIKNGYLSSGFHLTPPLPSLPFFGLVPRMMTDLSLLGDSPYCNFLPCVCKPCYVPGTKIM